MWSGEYVIESDMEAMSKGHADMIISFGRLFISSPDLPLRLAIAFLRWMFYMQNFVARNKIIDTMNVDIYNTNNHIHCIISILHVGGQCSYFPLL